MVDALSFLDQEIQNLKDQGVYRIPRVLSGEQQAVSYYDGRRVINLSSNNYLGLANHPRLKEAAIKATEKLGVGSGAVRTIAGTMDIHREFEEKLAKFKNVEACLVFQSGFTANSGTVSCILGREDVIISDELNHASIIDGSRLSRAQIVVYPHGDMDALREALETSQGRRTLVVTDGVFSMDGDIAKLPEIADLAEEYGAILMVDDAHASGVLGRCGRGTVDHYDLHGRVDIQVGTLSKALGGLGGYVAGPQKLIDYLVQRARPFLFSTSHPPGVIAAAMEAIDLIQEEPELIDKLWDNTNFFRKGLQELGFDTGNSATPIIPVIVGDERKTMQLADGLFEAGVFAQGIAFPTVPRGKARVRTIITAAHSEEDLQFALDAFAKVGRELKLI
ncbi:MAG TPA: glycine C-acetyltransferase [Firmicutes bacterium]|nr:MAG: 2-amino-3-ketobutyrate CoA ligase [Peptococcaceae bacterium 1109]HHT72325.1 glycine C-acetyltransferase [Bacillota bacterium]